MSVFWRTHGRRLLGLSAKGERSDRFERSATQFGDFLARCEVPARDTLQTAAVAVIPWLTTAVPWYAVALAIGLARRGTAPTLVWDDVPFGSTPDEIDQASRRNALIGEVLSQADEALRVVRLSEMLPEPSRPEDQPALERLVDQNMSWRTRAASVSGDSDSSELRLRRELILSRLSAALPLVRGLFKAHAFDYAVVPGGVFASSGLFCLAGQEADVRVATFDSGPGSLLLSTDGVAAQQTDIRRAFAWMMSADSAIRDRAIAAARAELERRVEGKDRTHYQTSAPTSTASIERANHVLIPLNIEWDTAALGRHQIFRDTLHWLSETVACVLESCELQVVIRQHPAERDKLTGRLDVAAFLAERFGSHDRLRFIRAEDPVNTYDLLKSASLVLTHVSTVGVESAAMGKPVVAAGASYYSDLGFVWTAETDRDYLELVKRGVDGELEPLPEQEANAWVCYYLTQVCNRLWTRFTPQPQDFEHWSELDPKALYGDASVEMLLRSIDEGTPLSLLKARRNEAS